MEKIGVIELNEKTLNLTIIDVANSAHYNVFERISETFNLGEQVRLDGLVSSSKIAEVLKTLKMFRKVCENNKVDRVVSFCTSFIKESKNQKSFFDELYNNTAFSFSVLSKEDEIKTAYTGVINTTEVPKGIIINVDAHKTYLIQYNRRSLITTHILDFGAVSLANENLSNAEIVKKVKTEVEKLDILKNMEEEIAFVGCGSFMISVGKLARKAAHYPLDLDNNYNFSTQTFDVVYNKVKDLDLDKTKKLKGISEDRADSFVSGMSILKGIIEGCTIENITISSGTFEQGLIYENILTVANEKPLSDMLVHSLEGIRIFNDRQNSNNLNVLNLAMILFKQLKVMHKLPRSYAKPLKIAASMYDCGARINFDNHSNFAFDVIVNSNIASVSHKDLLIAAFACKYQNLDNMVLADWVKYSSILTEEDLDAVRKLSVVINLAQALDKSRSKNVLDVCCDILGDSIIMKTVVEGDASFDIKQGMKVGGDFKKILKKHLQII